MAKESFLQKIKDTTSREFQNMGRGEMLSRLTKMDKMIQRRIQGFSTYGKGKGISQSPALRQYLKAGGETLAHSEKMTYREMQTEYIRGMNFLKAETGTASAWKKTQAKIIAGINKELGKYSTDDTVIELKRESFDRFFDLYSRLIEENPQYSLKENKYEGFRGIARMLFEEGYGRKSFKGESTSAYKPLSVSSDSGDVSGKDTRIDMSELSTSDILGGVIDSINQLLESEMSPDEFNTMFRIKKKKPVKARKHKAEGENIGVKRGSIDVDIDIDDIL